MALASFAVPGDVEDIYRPLTPEETALATGLLAAASLKLRVRVPDIDARIAGSELLAAIAKNAVASAAKRVLQNPDSWRQLSETTGPFSTSGTLDAAVSSGALYLAADDLVGLVSSGGPVFGSVRLRMGLA
jgi:hypothetical protein